MIKNKVILTDADGVLLDWQYHFMKWMDRHNYELVRNDTYDIRQMYGLEGPEGDRLVRMFNESATIRKLTPLRDSVKYVKKLHEEHGFIFHVITSLSNDQYSQHLRIKNLRELFGNTAFEEYVFLDTGADKDEVLEKYRDTECYWIEDKKDNAALGADLGLDTLLMGHHFNEGYEYPGVRRVECWKDVYDIIIGS